MVGVHLFDSLEKVGVGLAHECGAAPGRVGVEMDALFATDGADLGDGVHITGLGGPCHGDHSGHPGPSLLF